MLNLVAPLPAVARNASIIFALSLAWQFPAMATNYLGSAANFAVLGGAAVSNTGITYINGDLGVSPGTAITGYGSIVHNGVVHAADAVAALARDDIIAAAVALAGQPFTMDLTGIDLGTLGPLAPGVYRFASSAQLTGLLTLDFTSDPDGDFIFQIGSTLTTASNAQVLTIGGGSGAGLYWNVGSAATLGTGTIFAGNIIAQSAITLTTGAKIICGRALAINEAVTMDTNVVSNNCAGGGNYGTGRADFGSGGFAGAVPEPASWAMLVLGFGGVGVVMRRRQPRRAIAA